MKYFKQITILSIIVSTLSLPLLAFALEYTPISGESAKDLFGVSNKVPPLNEYLDFIFRNIVRISGILAVLVMLFGGIQYMTSDAWSNKSEGKEKIKRALIGLAIVLSSILLLNTINPDITDFSFVIDEIKPETTPFVLIDVVKDEEGNYVGIDTDGDGVAEPSSVRSATGSMGDNELKREGNTLVITPKQRGNVEPVRIDTDGTEKPRTFEDPDWRYGTSVPGLNANEDYFVVVPINSKIPNNTKVTVTNHTTNKEITTFVGDRGPNNKGYGELSLAAAKAIGVWTEGMGNAAKQHVVTYRFHLDEKK